jgi:hypothetical protein
MNYKILSVFAFAVLLLSSASAMIVYSSFSNEAQSKVVTEGDSVTFSVDFGSEHASISSMKVKLYSGESITHSFLDSQTSGKTYSETYTFTASKAGTFEIRATGTDSINTDSNSLVLVVLPKVTPTDNTKPVITVLGSNPASVYLNHAYSDAGAIAYDNIDGDVTSEIYTSNLVNVYALGTYTVTYRVSDNAGNSATATRTVKVIAEPIQDTTKPVITMLGNSPVTIYVGDAYSDAGATAYDNFDGDITSRIHTTNNVNTNVVGTYSVTYSVSDNAGNSASVSRTVKVIAKPIPTNHAPVITSTPVNIVVEGHSYSYQVTAIDADGDALTYSLVSHPSWLSISSNGLITGTAPSVNTDTDYSITVRVSDGKANSEQIYNLIVSNVCPSNHAPVIDLISNDEVDEATHYSYQAHATDADGDALSYSISGASWLSISSSGLITGTAPSVSSNVNYNIVVAVSDGKTSVSKNYVLTVKDTSSHEHLPTINVISPIKDKKYTKEVLTFKVETDGDGVEFRLDNGARKSMEGNYDNVFTYTTGVLSNGEHTVTFYAINEHGQTSKTVHFSVKVGSSSNCSSNTVSDSPTLTDNTNTITGYSAVISSDTNAKQNNLILFYLLLGVVGLGTLITTYALLKRLNRRY